MRKILFSLFAMVIGITAFAQTTVTKTVNDLVSENEWSVSAGTSIGTLATSFSLDKIVTVSTSGSANCGSIWGTTTNDWRLYQNQNGDVTLSVASGYELVSATLTYSISNTGALFDGETTVSSGKEVTLSGSTKTFTVGNTGTKTNGQVKITQFSVTYKSTTAPTYTMSATDKNGKEVKEKFAASPLTVKLAEYAEGMTFKVNGADATYNAETGLTITSKSGSKANDTYEVVVYSSDGTALTSKVYTWIPTATSVSTLKAFEDGTEAILSMSNAKVTYVDANQKNVYIQDATRGILCYDLGLTGFEAYKQTAVNIWGKKATYKTGVVQFQSCDSTATTATVTPSATEVTPTAKTVAQTLLADNQLTYVKVSGAKIVLDGSTYYAVAGSDTVMLYDSFKTGLLTALETTPCFGDVTGIITIYNSTVELIPTALENVSNKIQGTCGTVTYAIDMEGDMVFAPTEGAEGTMAALGIGATARPWSAYASAVKTVKFEAGVKANATSSYMFKDMTNLESVDFTNFNTADVTTLKGFFQTCSSLKAVSLTGLDLAKVTDYTQMFDGCKALETIDLRNVSTTSLSKASKAKNMFANCTPDNLYLSKNFGPTTDGSYITLPTKKYMALDEAGNRVIGKDFDLPTDQAALYEYNATVENYGTYVTWQEMPMATVNIDQAAKVKIQNTNYEILTVVDGAQKLSPGQYMVMPNGDYMLASVKLNEKTLKPMYGTSYMVELAANDVLDVTANWLDEDGEQMTSAIIVNDLAAIKSVVAAGADITEQVGPAAWDEEDNVTAYAYAAPTGTKVIITLNEGYTTEATLAFYATEEMYEIMTVAPNLATVNIDNAKSVKIMNTNYETLTVVDGAQKLSAGEYMVSPTGDFMLAEVKLNNEVINPQYGTAYHVELAAGDVLDVTANWLDEDGEPMISTIIIKDLAAIKSVTAAGTDITEQVYPAAFDEDDNPTAYAYAAPMGTKVIITLNEGYTSFDTTLAFYATDECYMIETEKLSNIVVAEGGTVGEISTITIKARNGEMIMPSGQDACVITLVNKASREVVASWDAETITAAEMVYDEETYMPVAVMLAVDPAITAAGTYDLIIPAGTFYVGEDMVDSDEATSSFTIEAPAAAIELASSELNANGGKLTFDQSVAFADWAEEITCNVSNATTNSIATTATLTLDWDVWEQANVAFADVLEAGNYTLDIPAGVIIDIEQGTSSYAGGQITFTVEDATEELSNIVVAEGGTVGEISTITIKARNGEMIAPSGKEACVITLVNKASREVVASWDAGTITAAEMVIDEETYMPVAVMLAVDPAITAAGTYDLIIPAGTFYVGEDMADSDEATSSFTIEAPAAAVELASSELNANGGKLTFDQTIAFADWAEEITCNVTNVKTQSTATTATLTLDWDVWEQVNVAFADVLEAGTYTLDIPAGAIIDGEQGTSSYAGGQIAFTVEAATWTKTGYVAPIDGWTDFYDSALGQKVTVTGKGNTIEISQDSNGYHNVYTVTIDPETQKVTSMLDSYGKEIDFNNGGYNYFDFGNSYQQYVYPYYNCYGSADEESGYVTLSGWFYDNNGNCDWNYVDIEWYDGIEEYVESLKSVTVDVTSAGYATAAFKKNVTVPAGVKAYIVTGIKENNATLTMEEISVIPANTGVIIEAAEGKYSFAAASEAAAVETNMLKPAFTGESIAAAEGQYSNYVLQNQAEKGLGFYWLSTAIVAEKDCAYLSVYAQSVDDERVKAFYFGDEATAIQSILSGNAEIYDLQGHKLNKLQKGINIVNGKKIMVK